MIFGLFRRKPKEVKIKSKKAKKKELSSKAKKKTAPKKSVKAKKTTAKKGLKKVVKRPSSAAKSSKPVKEKSLQLVGKVTHFFPRVNAAVIVVTKGTIAIGDTLRIKGHTTDFKQKVASLQINNAPIKEAKKGSEIGLLVKKHVRDHDLVYKV